MKKYNTLIQILTKAVLGQKVHNQKEYNCFAMTNFKVVKDFFIYDNDQVSIARRVLPKAISLRIKNLMGSRLIELQDYQHHKHLILINYCAFEKTDFYFVFNGKRTFKVATSHSWIATEETDSTDSTKSMHGIPFWMKTNGEPAFANN